MLLDAGADPNISDKHGELGLPISIAASRGFAEIVHLLLNAGAKPADAAFMGAIYNGKLPVIQVLFSRLCSHSQFAAYICLLNGLIHAVKFGSPDLVSLLLRLGAEFDAGLIKLARRYGKPEAKQQEQR